MSALSIQVPYPLFSDADGLPLEDGNIYIGTVNLDPVTNPIAVYWDEALTIAAAQPIKTSGGYPVYQGTPARLYVGSDYSIAVKTKNNITVYSAPKATERYSPVVIGDINAANVITIASETGAISRTQDSVNNDTLCVFDFMTPAQIADVRSGLAGVNVTTPLQTAINQAAASGKRLFFPAGRYLTGALTIPANEAGRVVLDLDTKAILQAASASITVISMSAAADRLGPRIIRGGRIDGGSLADVIGLQIGTDTTAGLYCRVQDVIVTNCDEAVVVRNAQEAIFDGLICFSNNVGFVALSSVTDGGATVLQWYGCRFQNNRVNFFGRSNSVFPIGGWLFSGCTFQTGFLCGLALYGGQSGNGKLISITLDNCHFEANGFGTSPGDTETIRGQVVPRGNILITGTRLACLSGELGASILDTSFVLRESAVLTVRDANIGGGVVNQFDCDASSAVYLEGANWLTGSGSNINRWDGWNWDGGSGGCFYGAPIVEPNQSLANDYAGTGLFPNAPETGNTVGATASKVLDQHQGLVTQVAFLAAIGSTGSNRAITEALPMAFAVGDRAAVSMLVRADKDTTLQFQATGNTSTIMQGSVAVRTGWQRIVLFGQATAIESSGYNLFVYPLDDEGATVQLAKIMVIKRAAADGFADITAMIRNCWYDDLLSPVYGDAIPSSGTWPRGKQIIARAPSTGAARGWVKVTQGNTNVLGVDWINLGNL